MCAIKHQVELNNTLIDACKSSFVSLARLTAECPQVLYLAMAASQDSSQFILV